MRIRFGSCLKRSASEPGLIYGKTVILNWTELNQIVLKPCWFVVQLDRAMPAFKTCWINKASAPKVAQESEVRSKRNNGSVNSKRVRAPSPRAFVRHLSSYRSTRRWRIIEKTSAQGWGIYKFFPEILVEAVNVVPFSIFHLKICVIG